MARLWKKNLRGSYRSGELETIEDLRPQSCGASTMETAIMSDDLTKTHPQDASRINMQEPYEVNWWTHKFGVTKAQLQAAVTAVGTSAAAVAKHLGNSL